MSQHQVTTRQRRNVVLLDLDGTLTQSDPGIIACATKAFEELSLPVPDDQEMHRFIGPAIIESFRRSSLISKPITEIFLANSRAIGKPT